ncbi:MULTISPECIES: L-histidine N(alpha)-methyltransferase [unclassified Spirosoma]|uniref:L-histidine N(alpha)-methyltransferase n=1 Tax=unclassified Spirosoma TaxID=2621999 RepID=UPI000961C61C|nr:MULTISPECIES: L-histidine N(alpha)-methyltransferase [unclassified Spirosoma]MBN8827071.1 L-histidine N(alpha)-methyltransferase [Spirosoma sp.]OJW79903.1 MAG: dimethylhistidine N-methyltransferase [Spirosoma sp. 48-14]
MNEILVDSTFRQDVLKGLTAAHKYLLPKYFYDANGDALFQQIMRCPEYYLTRAETEILVLQSTQILQRCLDRKQSFDIVELGAGDGSKTIFLLKEALRMHGSQHYYPIDISPDILSYLEQTLSPKLPSMQISSMPGDYFTQLEQLQTISDQSKLVLFLGGTIGNMLPDEALQFFKQLKSFLRAGDHLLVGFDLKKNPQTILNAYNDAGGLTKAFNLNLLHRINRELGADFNPDQFTHYPMYDPVTGSCKSYLISTRPQQVRFDEGRVIKFDQDEPIYMEVSQKYSLAEIHQLALQAGFEQVDAFFDCRHQFTDVLWHIAPGSM